MAEKAFQDYYADQTSHCYGCGRLNEHGLQIKSYWEGWWQPGYVFPQIVISSNTENLPEWAKSRLKHIDFDVHFSPREEAVLQAVSGGQRESVMSDRQTSISRLLNSEIFGRRLAVPLHQSALRSAEVFGDTGRARALGVKLDGCGLGADA